MILHGKCDCGVWEHETIIEEALENFNKLAEKYK